jgi:hypothetical protein
VIVWPGTKLARLPLSVPGRLVSVVEPLNESEGEETATFELCGPSEPLQFASTGVTL